MSGSLSCRFLLILLWAGGLACSSGCLVTRVTWRDPAELPPLPADQIGRCGAQARAERIYAKAINYERCGRAASVDLYFEVARLTASAPLRGCFDRQRQLHESALMKVVLCGHRFGRLDPASGLKVCLKGQPHVVPISRHGFVWQPDDFDGLLPIGYYETNAIREKHQRRGVGIPVVVRRKGTGGREFIRELGVFPATMVLAVDQSDGCDSSNALHSCRLQLHDPMRVDTVEINGQRYPISKDTTAPLVYALQGEGWSFLNDFLNPLSGQQAGRLYMLEPYQPNKIPLVLIHGLLSDPFTWVEMINQLIVHPGFADYYQIWAFEYSTGNTFLISATELRGQLAGVRQHYDPNRLDPQLSNMLLVGHSMGGLIAKLQVTSGGDPLWYSIANRPLDELCVPSETREELRSYFYFEPSPDISRVVFMATPHQGSSIASGPAGKLAALLVNQPDDRSRNHDLMIRRNPGVFSKELSNRIPTSVDLLNPHSDLLQAMGALPIANHVCLHSIVGNRCWTLLQGKSDGIVPVASALDPRSISVKSIKATHSEVKGHPESIKEVIYILQEHLQYNYEAMIPSEADLEQPWGRIELTPAA